ncbi:Uncharacterised protein [Candidatus Bartonella washoeensis]|uniref:Type IV secretion system protein virB10 n=2 Tax=Candidatus Bartonella washoeensis TaxID=186739 RepID=J0QME8_9HYPH|nr:hypothetical protein [Bartonella washoeensis]EJF78859.1 hypothetical protein MCQ_01238 [Bartonella washoeensis Sb944nv]EJF86831.1 hypothetical protein MCW_00054 [Bartonella washoeensis 085-0475]SPU27887.1 Uncharacterised protein [Bartonella washoeensis]
MSDKSDTPINEDRGAIGDERNNISKSLGTKIVVIIVFLGFCAYVFWNILSTPTPTKNTAKPHKNSRKTFIIHSPL